METINHWMEPAGRGWGKKPQENQLLINSLLAPNANNLGLSPRRWLSGARVLEAEGS